MMLMIKTEETKYLDLVVNRKHLGELTDCCFRCTKTSVQQKMTKVAFISAASSENVLSDMYPKRRF